MSNMMKELAELLPLMDDDLRSELIISMIHDLTYEEKLKVYELLLALQQNQRLAEARPA